MRLLVAILYFPQLPQLAAAVVVAQALEIKAQI
jgi:hypothetical protein